MSDDIHIRRQGRAGRITLNRPDALNALTWEMCQAIDAAMIRWQEDDSIALVVIDAAGERAFCAGGDIQKMYQTGTAGDYDYGRRFWADEYRMNARIAAWPKPWVALMQGFTMGGGVGVSCHGSHRIVGETSRIAMPECGIGLVPDVGGSWLLAQAPGMLGTWLGLTGQRMGPGDAIHAGFADSFVPEDRWPDLIRALEDSGDTAVIADFAEPPPPSEMARQGDRIDRLFAAPDLATIWHGLQEATGELAESARKAIARNAPLSMAVTVDILAHLRRHGGGVPAALEHEFRFTARSMEHGDFLEGIRAAIIDKDRAPRWRHPAPDAVPAADLARMRAPFDEITLELPGERT